MAPEQAAATALPYSRREQRGWYFYDWANSTFASTVVTLFFGPYVTALAKAGADPAGNIHLFGFPLDPRALWGLLVSASVASQVIVLPLLGAVADYSPNKRMLMGILGYIGALTTAAMYFLEGNMWVAGSILFLIANLAFGGSIVVYNSFLPEIAPPEERDAVSSRGWGIGYLGGGLLLALNLVLFLKAKALGISEGLAVRINLSSAGIWWALFTVIPLAALRKRPPSRQARPGESYVWTGFHELLRTILDLRRYPQTLTYLIAYLLYNDAIQAVIALASQFGSDELKIPMSFLTMTILMVQFVAFAGAFGFNYVAAWLSAKRAVMLSLVIWTGVLVAMYVWVRTDKQYFIMAAIVAIVLGGSQALSRSLFSQMIPRGREAEYFSLYEISDKGTSWLAPLLFSLALTFTHNYRRSILSLILFFILGLLMLAKVNVRNAAIEAGNSPGDIAA